jgi:hypothetical protein
VREGVYHAQVVPDFRLDVARLWRDQLPGVEATQLTIAGEAYARHLQAQLRRSGFNEEGFTGTLG